MAKLGIITGLVREANCLGKGFSSVRCSGPGPARAAETARALLGEGRQALLSFGFCGGLDPALKSGALVVPETVILEDGSRIQVDGDWRARLLAKLDGETVVGGALVGSSRVVGKPEDKRRLYAETDAVAVDMESHAIVQVCAQTGSPFLAVRVVCDESDGEVPETALGGVDEEGRDQLLAVALALLGRPWDLPALLRLRSNNNSALKTLRRVALLVGPSFGLED